VDRSAVSWPCPAGSEGPGRGDRSAGTSAYAYNAGLSDKYVTKKMLLCICDTSQRDISWTSRMDSVLDWSHPDLRARARRRLLQADPGRRSPGCVRGTTRGGATLEGRRHVGVDILPPGPCRPVKVGQSIRLSAINGRPERRSDDGHTILKLIRRDQNNRPDLVFQVSATGFEPVTSLVRLASVRSPCRLELQDGWSRQTSSDTQLQ
jgi:hypothetical protein